MSHEQIIADPVSGCLYGIYRLHAGSSFRHDGFIYHVLDGSGSLRLGQQSGSWAGCGVGSSAEETFQVLNAGLNHGRNPCGATYAYAVASETVLPAERQPDPGTRFHTVVNTPEAQAVWDNRDSQGQAVFYRQGEVGFPDGQFVAVDRGCLLLYRRVEQKAVITLAEGKREAGMISLALRGKVNSRASVSLPQADAAGTSMTLILMEN